VSIQSTRISDRVCELVSLLRTLRDPMQPVRCWPLGPMSRAGVYDGQCHLPSMHATNQLTNHNVGALQLDGTRSAIVCTPHRFDKELTHNRACGRRSSCKPFQAASRLRKQLPCTFLMQRPTMLSLFARCMQNTAQPTMQLHTDSTSSSF
jgi:hypothetical protein